MTNEEEFLNRLSGIHDAVWFTRPIEWEERIDVICHQKPPEEEEPVVLMKGEAVYLEDKHFLVSAVTSDGRTWLESYAEEEDFGNGFVFGRYWKPPEPWPPINDPNEGYLSLICCL